MFVNTLNVDRNINTLIDSVIDMDFDENIEVCRCLGVKLKDVKRMLIINKNVDSISFTDFRKILDCGDVCEQCLTINSNKNRVKITLEEIFVK